MLGSRTAVRRVVMDDEKAGPVPDLGEHKEEVLRDAGLTDYEIHELGIAGAFGVEVVAGW